MDTEETVSMLQTFSFSTESTPHPSEDKKTSNDISDLTNPTHSQQQHIIPDLNLQSLPLSLVLTTGYGIHSQKIRLQITSESLNNNTNNNTVPYDIKYNSFHSQPIGIQPTTYHHSHKNSNSSNCSTISNISNIASAVTDYDIGDLVLLTRNRQALIRYNGNVSFDTGTYFGVELLAGSRGDHNGIVHGIQYFTCSANHGLLIKHDKIIRRMTKSDIINGSSMMGKRHHTFTGNRKRSSSAHTSPSKTGLFTQIIEEEQAVTPRIKVKKKLGPRDIGHIRGWKPGRDVYNENAITDNSKVSIDDQIVIKKPGPRDIGRLAATNNWKPIEGYKASQKEEGGFLNPTLGFASKTQKRIRHSSAALIRRKPGPRDKEKKSSSTKRKKPMFSKKQSEDNSLSLTLDIKDRKRKNRPRSKSVLPLISDKRRKRKQKKNKKSFTKKFKNRNRILAKSADVENLASMYNDSSDDCSSVDTILSNCAPFLQYSKSSTYLNDDQRIRKINIKEKNTFNDLTISLTPVFSKFQSMGNKNRKRYRKKPDEERKSDRFIKFRRQKKQKKNEILFREEVEEQKKNEFVNIYQSDTDFLNEMEVEIDDRNKNGVDDNLVGSNLELQKEMEMHSSSMTQLERELKLLAMENERFDIQFASNVNQAQNEQKKFKYEHDAIVERLNDMVDQDSDAESLVKTVPLALGDD